MKTLTVTAKGQVTLRKDLLRHLGVEPGQRLEIRELPGGRIEVRAAKPTGTIENFLGALAGKSTKRLELDEIDEIATRKWADEA